MAAQVNYELDYQRLNSSTSSQSALNPVHAQAQVCPLPNTRQLIDYTILRFSFRFWGQSPITSMAAVAISIKLLSLWVDIAKFEQLSHFFSFHTIFLMCFFSQAVLLNNISYEWSTGALA